MTVLLLALLHLNGSAQSFQFKTSKVYCLLNFLETATQQPRTSPVLYAFIQANTRNDAAFATLCKEFSRVPLYATYRFEGYPADRTPDYNIHNLLVAAAVNSRSIEDFKGRVLGYLPSADLIELLAALQQAEGYYDRLIWRAYQGKLQAQEKALQQYAKVFATTLAAAQRFYHTSWPANTPFTVALYPIPGKAGDMLATPHVNNLCVGVLTDTTDYPLKASIVLHEMCHIFYGAQAKAQQQALDGWFQRSRSAYARFAYNYIDEGLATAIGNGWGVKQLAGSVKDGRWYGNDYIDGFAKELYPLVDDYLTRRQAVDSAFVARAVARFEKRFPRSPVDYNALFYPNVTIYNESEQNAPALYSKLSAQFQLLNVTINALADPESRDKLRNAPGTQLIVLENGSRAYIPALQAAFPQLNGVPVPANSLLGFVDARQRSVIVLVPENRDALDALFKRLKTNRYLDKQAVTQP